MIEWHLVTKEERFVGGHRLDDRRHQQFVAALELINECGEINQADLARNGQKPAFDQILLVGRKNQTRALLEALAQVIVIERRHDRSPENKPSTLDAISPRGRTAEHKPA